MVWEKDTWKLSECPLVFFGGDRARPPQAIKVMSVSCAEPGRNTNPVSGVRLGVLMLNPGSRVNMHSHETLEEVYFCLKGSAKINHVDDKGNKEEIITEPFMTVVIRPGIRHDITPIGPEPFWCQVHFSDLQPIRKMLGPGDVTTQWDHPDNQKSPEFLIALDRYHDEKKI